MSDDKALHDAADRVKSDLNHGVADRVARGDELTPPPRVDAFAARKAMFKKADGLRGGIDTTGGDVDPAMVAAMMEEAAGAQPIATDAAPVKPVNKDALQVDGDYVSIPVEGGQPLRVAKRDVEREGGATNYLRRRQLDEEQAQLARDKAETARMARELREAQRQPETQRKPSASQDDSAHGDGSPPSRNRTGSSETGAALDEKASRLAAMIYGGEEQEAKQAILEILTQQATGTGNLSEADILRLVENRSSAAARVPPVSPAPTSVDIINSMINDMARREYADICNDPVAQPAAFAKFVQLCKLPDNRDRRAVDVARDACEWARAKFGDHPRARVVEQKRGLPPIGTSSGLTDTSLDEEEALTPSQVIDQMAQRRNFNRRS